MLSEVLVSEVLCTFLQTFHGQRGGRGIIRLRQRTTEWVTNTFREHNNEEANQWADKGAKGRVEGWVDTTRITWREVTGLCGFWDGSCDNGKCGCGTVIMAYSDLHATKSVDLYQGTIPWMPRLAYVVC